MKRSVILMAMTGAVLSTSALGIWQVPYSGKCNVVATFNNTPYWAWITVQDLGKTRNLDWGYVAPFKSREWRSGQYACGSWYYVRAEFKAATGQTQPPGDPPNIGDTRVQIHPTLSDANLLAATINGGNAHGTAVYLKVPLKNNIAYADMLPLLYEQHGFWLDVDDPSFVKVDRWEYFYLPSDYIFYSTVTSTPLRFSVTQSGTGKSKWICYSNTKAPVFSTGQAGFGTDFTHGAYSYGIQAASADCKGLAPGSSAYQGTFNFDGTSRVQVTWDGKAAKVTNGYVVLPQWFTTTYP